MTDSNVPIAIRDQALAWAERRYRVGRRDILGPSRVPHIVEARWAAIKRCVDRGLSLRTTGAAFNRHHTTVLHATRNCERSTLREDGR